MLSACDKLILKKLQDNFPLVSRPYQEVAACFGLSEDELIWRLRRLKKKGIIRYVGAVFDTRRLGLSSALVAVKIEGKKLKKAVRLINSFEEVTHNYLRQGPYNVWFTLTATSKKRLNAIVNQIKQKLSIKEILVLYSLKVYKIDARFEIK
ncbi:MAG: Lrp/AsnC family transcriptional regulator [Candidatus Omnitrophica bacterium]|nr:Lrp/AsnC family transcriptional regulator [Candidatus Omnitrophota bacterium]